MVECAGKGMGTPCAGDGDSTRRCGACGAVGYCSASHQRAHWSYHKEECERFQRQAMRAEALDDFPFPFCDEIKKMNVCTFLMSRGLHRIGMWKAECCCSPSTEFYESNGFGGIGESWNLSCSLCPCTDPKIPLLSCLRSWNDYYQWRQLPIASPVALLLHWPLTVYHCIKLNFLESQDLQDRLIIHYLGPRKEISQLAVFRELSALFPDCKLLIEFFGPDIPKSKDGVRVEHSSFSRCIDDGFTCTSPSEHLKMGQSNSRNSSVTLQFFTGFYHERYNDRVEACSPHIIVAPNAGIAAYSSWLPTIELIRDLGIPAFFSDYCEEAAELASHCIASVTGRPLRFPVQVNPFRQPVQVENNALYLPCYSNCFLLGM